MFNNRYKLICSFAFAFILLSILCFSVNANDWSITDNVLTIQSDKAIESKEWKDELFTEVVITEPVSYIPKNSFNGNLNITKVTMADSVKTIDGAAFYTCENLTTVILGKGLVSTATSSFGGCSHLKEIIFPEGFVEIGESSFYKCYDLSNVYLPSTLEKIDAWAFYYCSSLKSIDIPSTVKEIQKCAFYRCFSLEEIVFPDSMTEMPNSVCYQDYALKKVTMPDQITIIHDSAFEACGMLSEINIPSKLEKIEFKAFSNCDFLTVLSLPNTINELAEDTFELCDNLVILSTNDYTTDYCKEYNVACAPLYKRNDLKSNSWYSKAVAYCIGKNIMIGASTESFRPVLLCDRNMGVLALAKLFNADLEKYSSYNTFIDVPISSWYHNACEWAFENGISKGVGRNEFKPTFCMTKEQLLLMLFNACSDLGYDMTGRKSLDNFYDAKRISYWSKDACEWAYANGLVAGLPNGMLLPDVALDRRECAQIIYKAKLFMLSQDVNKIS